MSYVSLRAYLVTFRLNLGHTVQAPIPSHRPRGLLICFAFCHERWPGWRYSMRPPTPREASFIPSIAHCAVSRRILATSAAVRFEALDPKRVVT
jgi:hypothetical protein